MNWRKKLKDGHTPITFAVLGTAKVPPEPQLLEAIANHPDCGRLLFIPYDQFGNYEKSCAFHDAYLDLSDEEQSEVDLLGPTYSSIEPVEYHAFDMKDALKRKSLHPPLAEDAADSVKRAFAQAEPIEISLNEVDCAFSNSAEHITAHTFLLHGRAIVDHPVAQINLGNKLFLPKFASIVKQETDVDVCPPCEVVHSVAEAEQFMQENGFDSIVLKAGIGVAGMDVTRLYRERPNGPLLAENTNIMHNDSQTGDTHRFMAENWKGFPSEGLLAMKWMQPEKGDLRVVCINDKAYAAINRVPKEGSWMANTHQGASIQYIDMDEMLSESEQARVEAAIKITRNNGLHFFSLDMLADETGERYVSEINTSISDNIRRLDHKTREIDKRMDHCIADEVADEIFDEYALMMQMQAKRVVEMLAKVESAIKPDATDAPSHVDRVAVKVGDRETELQI